MRSKLFQSGFPLVKGSKAATQSLGLDEESMSCSSLHSDHEVSLQEVFGLRLAASEITIFVLTCFQSLGLRQFISHIGLNFLAVFMFIISTPPMKSLLAHLVLIIFNLNLFPTEKESEALFGKEFSHVDNLYTG